MKILLSMGGGWSPLYMCESVCVYGMMNSTGKYFCQNNVICCPHVLGTKLISNT